MLIEPNLNKPLPHVSDIEVFVLGAIMLERDAFPTVSKILTTKMFYSNSNQMLFTAAQELFDAGHPIDIGTMCAKLKSKEQLEVIGGPFVVSTYTNKVASAANIEYHCFLIKQEWIKREMIHMGTKLIKDSMEDSADCFDILNQGQGVINNIMLSMDGKQVMNLKQLSIPTKTDIIRRSVYDELPGISTGFRELDEVVLGLMKSDLIIIAARPGVGKSSFVMQIAKQVANDKKNIVAVFSLEMTAHQLVMRLIANEVEINSNSVMRGTLNHEEQKLVETLDLNYPNLILDDTPAINIRQLRSRVMKIRAEQGELGLIIIDYLQLMSSLSHGETRDGQLGEITRGLKQIGKDFNVPVIALSQLSREVEKRKGKRPQLSDLRECGSIENDADSVWFLFRPDYYKEEFETTDSDGKDLTGLCKVIIAKNRHGALKDVKLRFIDKYVKFESLDKPAKVAAQLQIDEPDKF